MTDMVPAMDGYIIYIVLFLPFRKVQIFLGHLWCCDDFYCGHDVVLKNRRCLLNKKRDTAEGFTQI